MPRNNLSSPPPETMTWGRAAPVLAISAIFDLVRIFFEFFWFFGPAAAALYCGIKYGDTAIIGSALAKACVLAASVAGATGIEVTAPFGVIMAMAVGLFGWLTVGGYLLVTNSRIFKENALWFAGSLLISEVPFIGSIPAITLIVWKMYRTQIKTEQAALKKYQEEQAAAQLQERNQQLAQIQATQVAQAEQQAENDAVYAEAANDAQYAQEMDNAA